MTSTLRRKTVLIGCLAALFVFAYFAAVFLTAADYSVKNPKTTSIMERRRAEERKKGRELAVNYQFVPYTEISEMLIRAVIVGEDTNFCSHRGVDYAELRIALSDAWRDRELPRGASTITQQLAKNLYLSSERTLLRKLQEALLAYWLERSLSKRRILELYLNVIEFGEGVFGAEAAARHYFNKTAKNLSEAEAFFLAAILPGPNGRYSPTLHRARVTRRSRTIELRTALLRLNLRCLAVSRTEFERQRKPDTTAPRKMELPTV